MGKLRKKLLYELQREPEEKKLSLQARAGRLFVGFLILMLLLTFVSRAAASVITARVDATSPQKGTLKFEVSGVGTLGAKAEKYLKLHEGIRIAAVFVKEGQNVEEGELLFQYDVKDLEDILDDLEDEVVKAELNLQKERLNYKAGSEGGEEERAELTLERAKLDLKIAKETLKSAKKNIIKERIKEKKDAYEEADKAYLDALEAYDDQEDKKQKAVKEANKRLEEAKEALEELYVDQDRIDTETVLANFKAAVGNNNSKAVSEAEANIFKRYYGEAEYEKHRKEVERARKALSRANEDYWNWMAEALGEEGLSSSEYTRYRRAIEDAEDALAELTKKDNDLTAAMGNYRNAILYNKTDIEKAYGALHAMLYTEDKDKEKLIKAANKAVISAEESLEETGAEWQKLMDKAERAVLEAEEAKNKAEEQYDEIRNNTYDYSQEVKAEEMQVITAERNLEDAKIGLKAARKSDADTAQNNQLNRQLQRIDLELVEMELESKKEAAAEIKDILEEDGKVASPVTGVLVELGAVIGDRITGAERVCFALRNYGFEAKVSREEAKHLAVGDEMMVQVGDSREELAVLLENISPEDAQGKLTITGIMPKGNYSVGTPASFKVSKKSEQYRSTIPVQALRMDENNRTYVLVAVETNTILGNELTALRMDVTVLGKDHTTAAIEDGPPDNIIVSSNKNIKAGDRVRLNDND